MAVDEIKSSSEERYFETWLFPIWNQDTFVLIGGIATDITERIKTKKLLEKNAQELKERNFQLEKMQKYLNQEIEKAIRIHLRSLPKIFPQDDRFFFSAFYQPAARLGGEYYDIIKKGDKLILYLSDVSGHGLEGALLSSFVKDMIQSYIYFNKEEMITPEGILTFLYDEYVKELFPYEYFVCIFIIILHLGTGELEYLGSGFHEFPLLSLPGKDIQELMSNGLPISTSFPKEKLNLTSQKTILEPSATLLLHTDGITEHLVDNEFYGKRLKEVFVKNRRHSPNYIMETIKEDFKDFNHNSLQGNDDITLLVMKRIR